MDSMGLNTPELEEICDILQKDPDIYGAKISGSGLGRLSGTAMRRYIITMLPTTALRQTAGQC